MSKQSKRDRQRQNREARREYETQLARRRKTWKTVRTFAIIAVPILVIGIVVSVTSGGGDDKNQAKPEYATISTTMGDIVLQLDPKEAPKSEAQFARLADKGFYDGQAVHRVASNPAIIQSGDPKGDGTGGSGTTVPDELPTKPYAVGDLAFANSGPDTSDSQWFIVTGQSGTQLPLSYNRFGRVIVGLEVAQAIQALVPTSGDGPPTTPVTVNKIAISGKKPTATTTTSTSPSTRPSS